MISIIIPLYNHAGVVGESIQSALEQDYPDKEILVIDNASTDNSYNIAQSYRVRLMRNTVNLGLGGNLDECVKHSKGEYIIILCSDDLFTNQSVVSDMIKIFEENPKVGVIGRNYYQFFDGYRGAVMTIRNNIFISSCQPSGMGFRKKAIKCRFSNKLFIEVPFMVKEIIGSGWEYRIIPYDTIAARLHIGKTKNSASDPDYYKTPSYQSPTLNWYEILEKPVGMYMGFIQLKNNAPHLLAKEIAINIRLNPKSIFNIGFWFCVLVSLLIPSQILKPLTRFYRHRITRKFVKIIRREEWKKIF